MRPASIAELAQKLTPFAPTVTAGWEARIDHIVQQARIPDPSGKLLAIPLLREDAPHAWGNTRAFRRNLRGGLLGLALGASAALVAGGIWWLATTRADGEVASGYGVAATSGSQHSAPVNPSAIASASLVMDESDAGNNGSSPAKVPSAAASSAAPPRTGAPRSDPLGDRY